MNDFTGAETDLDRAIAMDPQDVGSLERRAAIRWRQNRMKEALADYDRVIALSGSAVPRMDFFYRGRVKQALSDLSGAIADYDAVLAMEPNFASAYVERGSAKAEKNDFAAALVDLDHAIKLDPSVPRAFVFAPLCVRGKMTTSPL